MPGLDPLEELSYISPSRRRHNPPRPETPQSAASSTSSPYRHPTSPPLSQPKRHHSFHHSPAALDDDDDSGGMADWEDMDAMIGADAAMMEEMTNAQQEAEQQLYMAQLQPNTTAQPQPKPNQPLPLSQTTTRPALASSTTHSHTTTTTVKRKLLSDPAIDLTADELLPASEAPPKRQKEGEVGEVVGYKRQLVFYRPPITGEFITVTNGDGDRVYLTLVPPALAALPPPSRRLRHSLLSTSIAYMRATLNEQYQQLAIQASLNTMPTPPHHSASASPARPVSSQLWVDKYRPTAFVELLSPADINRTVLSWLLEWDVCVFGRQRSSGQQKLQQHQNSKQHDKLLHTNNNNNQTDTATTPLTLAEQLASRPQPRVLLLSGAAGLGKTTLAHVLARHAGYATIEVNASDDRTEEQLIEKVRGAVEMRENVWSKQSTITSAASSTKRSADGSSKRPAKRSRAKPHALILDEIDGVLDGQSSAIDALLAIINAAPTPAATKPTTATEDNSDDDNDTTEPAADDAAAKPTDKPKKGRRRGKRQQQTPPMRRPIICICNDPYVPALRALRAAALHVPITQPSSSALVSRLREIARCEGLEVEDEALRVLVEMVGGDVRSSVNTLQFVHHRMTVGGSGSGKRLNADSLRQLGVGVKDMTKGRFDLLDRVLNAKREKGNSGTSGIGGSKRVWAGRQPASTLDELFIACQQVDDPPRFLTTLHHNYLALKLPDPTLTALTSLAHAFSSTDSGPHLGGSGGSEEDGEGGMVAVWPAVVVSVWDEAMRSIRRGVRVETDDSFVLHVEREKRRQIVRDWLLADQALSISSSLSLTLTVTQFLPQLLTVLSPQLRPVAFNLLSGYEKRVVDRLIDNMVHLALNWQAEASSGNGGGPGWYGGTGATDWVLTPRIDLLSEYGAETPAWLRRDDKQPAWMKGKGSVRAMSAISGTDGAGSKSELEVRHVIPSKIRQLLSKEVEYERIKQAEAKRRAQQTETDQQQHNTAGPKDGLTLHQRQRDEYYNKQQQSANNTTNNKPSNTSSATTTATPSPPTPSPQKRRGSTFLTEFSTRLKNKSKQQSSSKAVVDSAAAAEVVRLEQGGRPRVGSGMAAGTMFHFQYKEGFTQAVKRPVTMRHFM